MLARPGTSSGPGSSAHGFARLPPGGRVNYEKRMSKDDMDLTGRMGRGVGQRRGLQPYRIGVKGGPLPTPESSPDNYPVLNPPLSISTRMETPESSSPAEIPIGMAIGSPSHPPDSFMNRQPPVWEPMRDEATSPSARQQAATPASVTPRLQKSQKRNLFGGLFGSKRNAEHDMPAISSDPNRSQAVDQTSQKEGGRRFRSNTVSDRRAMPKHKPLVTRSNTDYDSGNRRAREQEGPPGVPGSAASGSSPGLLLDIEIPDIRLERYSVMFSGLLSPAGQSSLLARRQATLEKLKTLQDGQPKTVPDGLVPQEEDARELVRPRRATSPHPVKSSPAFSLFPQGYLTASPAPAPSRLFPLRSNTSPALLRSPSKPGFTRKLTKNREPQPQSQSQQNSLSNGPPKETTPAPIIPPRTTDERNRAAQMERPRAQQRQPAQQHGAKSVFEINQDRSFYFGPDEAGRAMESPASMDESDAGEEVVDTHPLRPRLQEPQWQIVNPRPHPPPSGSASESHVTTRAPAASTTVVQTRSASVSTASSTASNRTTTATTSTNTTHQSLTDPAPSIDDSDAALRAAVEHSIARQISISRQQRQLLRGDLINSSATRRRGAGAAAAAALVLSQRSASASASAAAGDERVGVAETKSATPRLVVVPLRQTTTAEGLLLAQNRKSERVLLEHA